MSIKQTRLIMGMPITVEVVDALAPESVSEKVFSYFNSVDEKFSTYKQSSEISKLNRGEITVDALSSEMKEVFRLSEETKNLSNGYFNIVTPEGQCDPSGLVKGWAILEASKILEKEGCKNFFVEAGGDIQTLGKNSSGEKWRVGIQNPFKQNEIVKVLQLSGQGMATSGTYARGQHIYNPHSPKQTLADIVSLTVIGPNVYEADRFATAAFAMGNEGIKFIEKLQGFEGYQIDSKGIAVVTSNFTNFII